MHQDHSFEESINRMIDRSIALIDCLIEQFVDLFTSSLMMGYSCFSVLKHQLSSQFPICICHYCLWNRFDDKEHKTEEIYHSHWNQYPFSIKTFFPKSHQRLNSPRGNNITLSSYIDTTQELRLHKLQKTHSKKTLLSELTLIKKICGSQKRKLYNISR